MGDRRFDILVRSLSGAAHSRRGAGRWLAGGVSSGIVARLRPPGIDARRTADCLQPGKACKHGGQCCSGVCRKRRCRRAPGQGICTIRQTACVVGGNATPCDAARMGACVCGVTARGASLCFDNGGGGACAVCGADGDCPGEARCVRCPSCTQGTACIAPCPDPV